MTIDTLPDMPAQHRFVRAISRGDASGFVRAAHLAVGPLSVPAFRVLVETDKAFAGRVDERLRQHGGSLDAVLAELAPVEPA